MRRYITKKVLKRTLLFLCIVVLVTLVDAWRVSTFLLVEERPQLPDIDECQISITKMERIYQRWHIETIIIEQPEKQILYDFAKSLEFISSVKPSVAYQSMPMQSTMSYTIASESESYGIDFYLQARIKKELDIDSYEEPHFGLPNQIIKYGAGYDRIRGGIYVASDEELYNAAFKILKTILG